MKPPPLLDRSNIAPGMDLSSCNVKDLQKFKQQSIAQGFSKHSLNGVIRHLLRCFLVQIVLPVFHTCLQPLLAEAKGTTISPVETFNRLLVLG